MTNIPNTAPPDAYGKDSDEWSIRVLLPAARLEHFIVRKQAVEGRVRQCGVNSVVASGRHFQAALGVICSG